MEKKISKMDVFVCRAIRYLMTLLSLFGLSKSLKSSLATWRFIVSVPQGQCGQCHNILRSDATQVLFSIFTLGAAFGMPSYYEQLTNKKFGLSISLFTISLFTGGIRLIQLSGKFRMEMGHALSTLFLRLVVLSYWHV